MERGEKALIIITPGFPSDELDTTCLPPVQSFVRAVNRNFPSLKIIILALRYPYTDHSYEWNSNLVIPLNGNQRFRIGLWMKAHNKLKRIVAQEQVIGLLNFWCLEAALIGSFFARLSHLPNLIWVHGQDARKNNPYVKFIRPKANELIALSEFLAIEFTSNHKIRPGHIIPNGIDVTEFTVQETERTIDLIGVGSLIPLKQYSIFIEVVAELAKTIPDLRAALCGAGPDLNTLREKVKALRLEANVTFYGELPHSQVLKMMQRSKLLLHPSTYEGYSTVCLEALYAGCHVVSFTKAENRTIDHWHLVANVSEMISVSSDVLRNTIAFKPTLVHDINDSARQLIKLFNQR